MTTNNAPSPLLALPEDLQRRLLAGCRYQDLFSLAAVCRAVRDVVNDPTFTAVRQSHGFVERGVVLVGTRRDCAVDIRSAQTRAVKVSIAGLQLNGDTTTDGRRMFASCWNSIPNQRIIYALDVISRQWSRFAPLPHNRALHCIEWYAGRIYVAGGIDGNDGNEILDSFCVYNEATRSWDALPDMPVGCYAASSGVIGDQLLIAGGSVSSETLRIFDFTTGQWRLGPPLPEDGVAGFADTARPLHAHEPGIVSENKLFMPGQTGMLIYDPLSDVWTQEPLPVGGSWKCACAHYGSIFVFLEGGAAYERAPGGSSWSSYRCWHAHARDALEAPAGEAHGSWGKTRVESILLG